MKWVSQTKHAIELVVLFAKIQNQTLNGLSKVKGDLRVLGFCGVVVRSVGASGCLEGFERAAGLLLNPLRFPTPLPQHYGFY